MSSATSADLPGIGIELRQQADFRFEVRFDNPAVPVLVTDEPSPIGGDAGPGPSQLLATAAANCLAASLLYAMRKYRNDPGRLRASARLQPVRNETGRLRIGSIDVDLHLGVPAKGLAHLERLLGQFEDFCTVTQSLRDSIPVQVRVFDGDGVRIHG